MASFCLPDWLIDLFLKCCLGTPLLFAVPLPFSRVISSASRAHTYISLHSSGPNCAPSVRNVLWVISVHYVCVWKELCISNNGSLNYFRQRVFRVNKNSCKFRDSGEFWSRLRHSLCSAGRCSGNSHAAIKARGRRYLCNCTSDLCNSSRAAHAGFGGHRSRSE